jgi:hypothetical protein
MAALGLALFTTGSPATGHRVPTAWFHDFFALTTRPPGGAAAAQSAAPVRPAPNEITR